MSDKLLKRLAKHNNQLIKPCKVKPENMWIMQDKILIKAFKGISQDMYNTKLLEYYRLMVTKKDNGQKLWEHIFANPCEMLARAKVELREKLK